VTRVDWIALGFVGLTALYGLRRGLVASALSAAAIVAGAVLGARIAPHLLHGGARSPYTPVAALAGAAILAIVLEALASFAGTAARTSLRLTPLGPVDSLGGLVLGGLGGLAIVWVAGAVALLLPGQTQLRQSAQQSLIVRRLTAVAKPRRLLDALARVDPLPAVVGPVAVVPAPDPSLLSRPGVRRAAPSVVRVVGTACGLSVEGSGWVARPQTVVTAAHVVAGEHDTAVEVAGSRTQVRATVVAFDSRNDVAVLRVPGLVAPALAVVDAVPGTGVAILGYPDDGPFTATAGRIGGTVRVFSRDAYGRPTIRTITSLRGLVRHGNSGGPAVDARGRVETTVFAASVGSKAGYGVPADPVRSALASARGPVSTGGCTG
jgi:S1-C subfamily serine protease